MAKEPIKNSAPEATASQHSIDEKDQTPKTQKERSHLFSSFLGLQGEMME
jgi:hypothetical protein